MREALAERQVRVAAITWKGMKGFAFVDVELDDGESVDAVATKLDGLRIDDCLLKVELDWKQQVPML